MNKLAPILFGFILLLFLASRANANPLVLSDSDINLIKQNVLWGNIVILFIESLGVSIFMRFFKYRISRTLLPVLAVNLMAYFIFKEYLILYERQDIGVSFIIEAIIILLETVGLIFISKARFIRPSQTKLNPALCFFAVAFFNVFSAFLGLVHSYSVAESVAYPFF